ncbi:MAG: c-type cytochrome [Gammaproteobacteria bacterium]|nr:c-type cytochrome [Gammaproteobacteria bacterium]
MSITMGNSVYAGVEAQCKICHDFGTAHKVGPGLKGIMGSKAGTTDYKNYSKSLKQGGWVWDEEHMRKWLTDGKKAIKEFTGDDNAKTTMPPQKLKGDKLDKVIEFLKGLK